MAEENKGDQLVLPPSKRTVRIDRLQPDDHREDRKLPPDHGPTPRFSKVPPGESLPPKDRG